MRLNIRTIKIKQANPSNITNPSRYHNCKKVYKFYFDIKLLSDARTVDGKQVTSVCLIVADASVIGNY